MCNKWYKKSIRRSLMDMHIEDWNENFMSRFDPEEYYNALKTSNVSAVMIYAQSHVGLCYWPTKSGDIHKGFVGHEDKMKRLIELCHNDSIDVVLYYSLIFNNRAYEKNKEWRMLDVQGNASRSKGGRYGQCCPNSTGYRNFVKAQIEEFCHYFDFEGVFFDMTFWPMVCYCHSCRERWEKEVGGEIPAIIDWNDVKWVTFNKKRHEWMGEFARFTSQEVRRLKPECSVEHQYGKIFDFWRYGNNENISEASDYIGTDLYGGIEEQSFACKAWYNLTQNQPFQYMTSCCYPDLSEHTTIKSMDLLRLCTMLTFMHHGASLLISAIDPEGTFDKRVYERMGEIYRETEKYEKYFKRGEMVYDVGVYYKLDGRMDVENNGIPVASQEASNCNIPHLDAVNGAARSLRKHHIPFGVVNSWRLDLLDKLSVLVLPDVPEMHPQEIKEIARYVSNGGKLYISSHSAPSFVEEIFGCKWGGFTEEDFTYMSPTENSDIMKGEYSKEYPLALQNKAAILQGQIKGEVLAALTLPYTIPHNGQMLPTDYFGKPMESSDPGYRFASIHSNPPGVFTKLPGIIRTSYGKGTIVWSALPIEKADRPQHSEIFAYIIRMLAGEKNFQFGAHASDTVECILFDSIEYNQKIMGVINLQNNFKTIPVLDTEVWIKVESKPKAVFRLPDEVPVDFKYIDGCVIVQFEKIDLYVMFVLQL